MKFLNEWCPGLTELVFVLFFATLIVFAGYFFQGSIKVVTTEDLTKIEGTIDPEKVMTLFSVTGPNGGTKRFVVDPKTFEREIIGQERYQLPINLREDM